MSVVTGKPNFCAACTEIGKSCVHRPSLNTTASYSAFFRGRRLVNMSAIKLTTCTRGFHRHIGHHQCFVARGLLFYLNDLENRGGSDGADLRIDWPEHGVAIHNDLRGRQCDHRAATHRVVGDEHSDFTLVLGQGLGNLLSRQNEPPGVCRIRSIG
jgi:hypothetical protein